MAANPAAENMAQVAFSTVFSGFGNFYVAICLLFFAFSTIIGWYFFGEQNVKYLFGVKAVKVYACIAVVCVALGAVLEAPLVWNLSDLFNALMVFPNLLALLALSGLVAKAARGGDALRKCAPPERTLRPKFRAEGLFKHPGGEGRTALAVGEGEDRDALHGRGDGVHGIKKRQTLRRKIEVLRVEMAPQRRRTPSWYREIQPSPAAGSPPPAASISRRFHPLRRERRRTEAPDSRRSDPRYPHGAEAWGALKSRSPGTGYTGSRGRRRCR